MANAKRRAESAQSPKSSAQKLGPAVQALLALREKKEGLAVPPEHVMEWVEGRNRSPLEVAIIPRIDVARVEPKWRLERTCFLSGRRFIVERGDVIPQLVFEHVDPETGTSAYDEPLSHDLHPKVISSGSTSLKEAIMQAIEWRLDEAWGLYVDACTLATLLDQEIRPAWPDCWPKDEDGNYANITDLGA